MTKAHAEDWQIFRCAFQKIETNAGFIRRARSGRQYKRAGFLFQRIIHAQRVIAYDVRFHAEILDVVDKIVNETVVIIDEEDHARGLSKACAVSKRSSRTPSRNGGR